VLGQQLWPHVLVLQGLLGLLLHRQDRWPFCWLVLLLAGHELARQGQKLLECSTQGTALQDLLCE
jgi:hypothetical protein